MKFGWNLLSGFGEDFLWFRSLWSIFSSGSHIGRLIGKISINLKGLLSINNLWKLKKKWPRLISSMFISSIPVLSVLWLYLRGVHEMKVNQPYTVPIREINAYWKCFNQWLLINTHYQISTLIDLLTKTFEANAGSKQNGCHQQC